MTFKPTKTQIIGTSIGIIAILILIIILMQKCSSVNTSVIVDVDSYKQQINAKEGKIQVLTNEIINLKDLQANLAKSNDATLKFLSDELKRAKDIIKKSGNVTVFTSTTQLQGETITIIDTVFSIDTFIFRSQYVINDTPWIYATFIEKDSNLSYNIELRDRYSLILGKSKLKGIKNLFKPFEPIAMIKTQNPYNKIDSVISYSIKDAMPSKFGIGASIGYGLAVNQNGITPTPFIGVSLNYNLIQFKKRIKK